MKRILGLAFVCAALIMLVGCNGVTLDAPDVDYTVTDDGATLALDWIAIADADGYYIYADGEVVDTLDDPETITYDADVPAAEYSVSAFAGEDESALTDIDCAPVVTSNVTVYGLSDPDTAHPSGLSFTSSGTAVPLSVKQSNYLDLDYIFDDLNFATLTLASPNAYSPPYNAEKNMSVDAGVTDFDAIDIADAPGGYTTQTTLAANAVYSLFMDQDDDNWDTDSDYFGKMKVESISGSTVVITVAYQTMTGLRWVFTQ